VEEALKWGGKADWNGDGYYFVENGQHIWKDVAKAVTMDKFKNGYLKTPDVQPFSVEECPNIDGDLVQGLRSGE
jgi:hypothetical protein